MISWGLLGWKYYANVSGPIQCEALANLGVTQIACAEKCFLILSRNGKVYTQAYNNNTLVCSNTNIKDVLLNCLS